MNQKKLSIWLKVITIATGAIGIFIYAFLIPIGIGRGYFLHYYPEMAGRYVPWVIFISLSAIPCCLALISAWLIANEIGADNSFSHKNAKHMKNIAAYAAADSIFFFIGNVILLLLNMSHPGVTLLLMAVPLIGVIITVAAACLSHLIEKAAKLQDENDVII